MRLRILKAAANELDDSFFYYEDQLQGLGAKFLSDILSVFNRIESNPKAWAKFSGRTRRCLAAKFPYSVIYQIRDSEILIVAIAHLHREPDYWKSRIEPDH